MGDGDVAGAGAGAGPFLRNFRENNMRGRREGGVLCDFPERKDMGIFLVRFGISFEIKRGGI